MEYTTYTKILNFLFHLLSHDIPLKGLVISTERLLIISYFLETYNKNGIEEALKRIETLTLEHLLEKEISEEIKWGSLQLYAMHLTKRPQKEISHTTLELYFKHFLNVEYNDWLEQNILKIIIRVFRNYLIEGDYHYKQSRKSYPVNISVSEKLLKEIFSFRDKNRISVLNLEIWDNEWLLEDRKKEFLDIKNKEKTEESENKKEG